MAAARFAPTPASFAIHSACPSTGPAEDQNALLSFHPVVVGNLVLFNSLDKIYAFDLPTGKPAWPVPPGTKDRDPGEILLRLDRARKIRGP